MIDFAALNNWGKKFPREEPGGELHVACKGNCGRLFHASWPRGIQCRIVSLTCVCGHVTPVDGEVNG